MSLASLAPATGPRVAVLVVALSTLLTAGVLAPSSAFAQGTATVEIPYEEFTLPNGLRVIVHADRKAPIVAVNLWHHVGSRSESRGRSGFAHRERGAEPGQRQSAIRAATGLHLAVQGA